RITIPAASADISIDRCECSAHHSLRDCGQCHRHNKCLPRISHSSQSVLAPTICEYCSLAHDHDRGPVRAAAAGPAAQHRYLPDIGLLRLCCLVSDVDRSVASEPHEGCCAPHYQHRRLFSGKPVEY